jgi:LasA protease
MDKPWRPGIKKLIPTSLEGSTAPLQGRRSAAARLALMVVLIISLAGCSLPELNFPAQLLGRPLETEIVGTPRPTVPPSIAILIPTAGPQILDTAVPPTITPTATRQPPFLYTTQSGDYLTNLAVRFGVSANEIQSTGSVPRDGLINPGQMLVIPHVLGETSPATLIMPDSEAVYSPTTLDLEIKNYVKDAGGYLNSYTQYIGNSTRNGADVVMMVAEENSINPRLLLALLEYESHWVLGQPGNLAQSEYPMGYIDVSYRGLYGQLGWAVRQLMLGYYGWRGSSLTQLAFPDQGTLRLSPELNAGTVAVHYYFSKLYNKREWMGVIYSDRGFPAVYEKMFGSPFVRAQAIEPFFPPNMAQPPLELPFYFEQVWSYTGGPHRAWAQDSPFAAIDFAPGSTESGCIPSQSWVLAAAPGLVIRSDNGVVLVDLDGDGKEQTGWVLMYLHIGSEKRVALGTRVNLNDPIGHPSCEGGMATGTHFHFARKYNGEWILADGPLPFVLSGWRAHAGLKEYDGTLTNNGKTVTACTCGSNDTKIIRSLAPGP